ncbi:MULTISPECIES: hypothetical protein [Bacillus]|uniref:Uncharacterized protein n=1 Tax=Bacillus paramycoides TaxID=2026194 RepID=A0ABU6N108_9BACI|nr:MULTISPECIES: hypothetical protein [Bacillus]KMN45512.1 hypothetical protein VK90_08485 [Bacillus sp. LK2]MED1568500.1 hypothetical protein [Bacillus paramycoides]
MIDGTNVEAIPVFFWRIYYSVLFIFLIIGILNCYQFKKDKLKMKLNILNLIFIVSIPVVSLLNSINRKGNEYDHFMYSLKQFDIWAIYTMIGYLYVIIHFFCSFYFLVTPKLQPKN